MDWLSASGIDQEHQPGRLLQALQLAGRLVGYQAARTVSDKIIGAIRLHRPDIIEKLLRHFLDGQARKRVPGQSQGLHAKNRLFLSQPFRQTIIALNPPVCG